MLLLCASVSLSKMHFVLSSVTKFFGARVISHSAHVQCPGASSSVGPLAAAITQIIGTAAFPESKYTKQTSPLYVCTAPCTPLVFGVMFSAPANAGVCSEAPLTFAHLSSSKGLMKDKNMYHKHRPLGNLGESRPLDEQLLVSQKSKHVMAWLSPQLIRLHCSPRDVVQ